MKKILILFLLQSVAVYYGFCQNANASNKKEPVNSHPEWIMQGNIYEVNIHQFTAV